MRSVGERDGLAAINGGVELGAVGQIAGVVNGQVLVQMYELACTDLRVGVDQGVGGLLGRQSVTNLRSDERRDVLQFHVGRTGQGIQRLGARCSHWHSGNLRREGRQRGATASGACGGWDAVVYGRFGSGRGGGLCRERKSCRDKGECREGCGFHFDFSVEQFCSLGGRWEKEIKICSN